MAYTMEKDRFKAVTHVVFDLDGLLIGLYSVHYSVD